MKEVTLTIDGKEVKAEEGTTVLAAAKKAGIIIPTICNHDELKPYTVCRLCMVEITDTRGRTSLDTACSRPVGDKLVIKTRSERVDKIRKTLLELMLAHAPDSPILLDYAKDYGANKDHFAKEPSFCILCGLCVRYCQDVIKKNAIGFVDRGIHREVSFIPGVAAKECWSCKACFPLCPTEALQAKYVLVESQMFPATITPESK
jgi:bidirectional [NiFe] hydrogenase diaphorase subunit